MKFIRDMMSRKSKEPEAEVQPVPDFESVVGIGVDGPPPKADRGVVAPRRSKVKVVEQVENAVASAAPDNSDEVMSNLSERLKEEKVKSAVNIWDMDDGSDSAPSAAPASNSATQRRRRNKTRVLGFNGDSDVVSMFDSAPKTKPAERTKFPVGWILVAEGPGRGECFTLEAGMSQIGRGDDQAIQLDFGDNSISRSNHAAIVYDTETHAFTLGHGGKKNIVRLNGNPVISNETLKTGDKIKIGETVLHFVPLCTEDFNWSDKGDAEESDDVAIA